jgi:hypothetical protein
MYISIRCQKVGRRCPQRAAGVHVTSNEPTPAERTTTTTTPSPFPPIPRKFRVFRVKTPRHFNFSTPPRRKPPAILIISMPTPKTFGYFNVSLCSAKIFPCGTFSRVRLTAPKTQMLHFPHFPHFPQIPHFGSRKTPTKTNNPTLPTLFL